MFSLGQIVVSSVVGVAASVVALVIHRRRSHGDAALSDRILWSLSFVVGVSILIWRAAGNTSALNDDPVAFVSPNDVLCPVITYVALGLYAGASRVGERTDWRRMRALLAIVSLIVNVVTI